MQNSNLWTLQTYPLSDFPNEFNSLSQTSQNQIESLLRELVVMQDPEDHPTSMDCPGVQGFHHAVKFSINGTLVLIVALDRIDIGEHHDHAITLYSCSE